MVRRLGRSRRSEDTRYRTRENGFWAGLRNGIGFAVGVIVVFVAFGSLLSYLTPTQPHLVDSRISQLEAPIQPVPVQSPSARECLTNQSSEGASETLVFGKRLPVAEAQVVQPTQQ